jgi:hypothetical protein
MPEEMYTRMTALDEIKWQPRRGASARRFFVASAICMLTFLVAQQGAYRSLLLNPLSSKVRIGTTNPRHLLHLAGTIGAEQLMVGSTSAEYLFDPDYPLAPLSEVAEYVKESHHLPGIPSADEMSKKGVSLGDMQAKLLAKIEERTLHFIQSEQISGLRERESRQIQERNKTLEELAEPGGGACRPLRHRIL